jgi:hypothetical protein
MCTYIELRSERKIIHSKEEEEAKRKRKGYKPEELPSTRKNNIPT